MFEQNVMLKKIKVFLLRKGWVGFAKTNNVELLTVAAAE